MSPVRESLFGTSQRHREPVDPGTINTAVQVAAAWLIAFICVSLIALLS